MYQQNMEDKAHIIAKIILKDNMSYKKTIKVLEMAQDMVRAKIQAESLEKIQNAAKKNLGKNEIATTDQTFKDMLKKALSKRHRSEEEEKTAAISHMEKAINEIHGFKGTLMQFVPCMNGDKVVITCPNGYERLVSVEGDSATAMIHDVIERLI